jgi:hypothetical protein
VEFVFDPELYPILSESEQRFYTDAAVQELIQRTHASSALFACELPGCVYIYYEAASGGLGGKYPVVRDGGALRLSPITPHATDNPRFKEFFL